MKTRFAPWLLIVVMMMAPIFAACAVATTTTPPPATTPPATITPPATPSAEVKMTGAGFRPQTVTIKLGATITWLHVDETEDTAWWWHSAISDTSLFDSGSLFLDATFSYTFAEAGIYDYHCDKHPYWTGRVIVVE